MSREAMKLALEALERYQVKRQDFDRFADEITALREALAEQPAQQEPVAKDDADIYEFWARNKETEKQQKPMAYGMWDTMLGKDHRMMMVRLDKGQDGCTIPLYTSPPAQRKPLTDEEIEALLPEPDGTAEVDSVRVLVAPGLYGTEYTEADAWTKESIIQVARAIEAAHNIKEGA